MKDWLVFLTDEQGRSYTVRNGQVVKVATATPLLINPGGLNDISIGWERSMPELGITRSFTAPLQYHLDGAAILKDLFYRQTLETKVMQLLHRRTLRIDTTTTPASYSWFYKAHYRGEVDPTTVKHDDVSVTASLSEGGAYAKYKANRATAHEYTLDDPDAILVKMDGINLEKTQNFLITSWTQNNGLDSGRHLIGISTTTADGEAYGIAFGSVFADADEPSDPASDDRYFLRAAQPVTGIRFRGQIKMTSPVSGQDFEVFLVRSGGATIQLVTASNLAQQGYTFDFDVTFDMAADERIFLYGDYGNAPTSLVIYQESEAAVSFKSKFETTYVKAFRPSTLHKRIAGKVLGDEMLAESSLLVSNEWPCLTGGDALRGLAGAVIKTTCDQFALFARVVAAAGIGMENGKLTIESYDHYLDESTATDLGPASKVVVTRATDQLVNTVKIGYEPQDIDNVNGRYAFNNTHTYSSPVTRVQKELTLVCPYIADPYVIEIQRINFDGKTTTDSDKDNRVMLLDVDLENPQTDPDLGTYYNLRRPAGVTITGVPDPDTIFNIGLSPKRLLHRQARLIDALFYGFAGKKLTFTTTERNRDLKTVQAGVTVEEKADYTIGSNPLFLPFYFDIDTEAPEDLAELMAANANRCFVTNWKGVDYTGFAIKVGINPTDNKAQAFKLLCAPSTNLQNLITHG